MKGNDKGKSITEPEMKACAKYVPTKKKNIEIPKEENTLLYEVCVGTQQLIDKHMRQDRKEKEHLDAEINHIANTACQIILVAKEEKRR